MFYMWEAERRTKLSKLIGFSKSTTVVLYSHCIIYHDKL